MGDLRETEVPFSLLFSQRAGEKGTSVLQGMGEANASVCPLLVTFALLSPSRRERNLCLAG